MKRILLLVSILAITFSVFFIVMGVNYSNYLLLVLIIASIIFGRISKKMDKITNENLSQNVPKENIPQEFLDDQNKFKDNFPEEK